VITKEELRKHLPTIEKMYDFCTEELGYYMPRYESWAKKAKCINENYLWGVIIGNIWCIKSADIKYPKKLKKKITKRELVEVLETELEGKVTGFDEDHYPDKQWLRTAIYTLNPNNNIFSTPEDVLKSNIPKQ